MTILSDLQPFVQGDTLVFELRLTDDNGDPLDVIGDVLYLTLKRSKDDSDEDAVLQKILNIESSELARFGVVRFVVSAEESNIAHGTYHYDYQWAKTQSGAGEITTVALGKVLVLQQVTRA